jgi:hypothetical protein
MALIDATQKADKVAAKAAMQAAQVHSDVIRMYVMTSAIEVAYRWHKFMRLSYEISGNWHVREGIRSRSDKAYTTKRRHQQGGKGSK